MGSTKFKAWYWRGGNRNKLNKRRLHKYHTDPSYREAVLQNTRRWRELHRDERIDRPKPPKVFFTIGEVADQVGVEQKTLRTLEKAKLIPRTSKKGRHRRFNKNQIALISAIVKHRKKVHYTDDKYQPKLAELSQNAFQKWGQ